MWIFCCPTKMKSAGSRGVTRSKRPSTSCGPRVPLIAVKCGRRGALVQQGEKRFAVPGIAVEPVDTVGAGDSFNAGFLTAWLGEAPAEQCALAGNITGALSTQRPGGTEAFRDRRLFGEFLGRHPLPQGVSVP